MSKVTPIDQAQYKRRAILTLIYWSIFLDVFGAAFSFLATLLFENGWPAKVLLIHIAITIAIVLYSIWLLKHNYDTLARNIYLGSEMVLMTGLLLTVPSSSIVPVILGQGSFVILAPFLSDLKNAFKWGVFACILTITALYLRSGEYHFVINMGGLELFVTYSMTAMILILYVVIGSIPGRVALQALHESEEARREIAMINAQLEHQVEERTVNLSVALEDAQTARIQAETANKHKSLFLANMSHELRTPLNAINGFSEVLLLSKKKPLDDHIRGKVEIIFSEGQHLLHLINNLLDLSKIEAGKMEIEPTWIDINTVLERVRTSFTTTLTDKGLGFSISSSVSRHVWVDDKKIYQILLNLISNAVKFTEEGSVTVYASQDADAVTISVEDTGIGIPEAQRESIFEEFRQIAGDHQRGHQGTGLGLAITKHLVELHGGRIWISGNNAKPGSTFSFTLPFISHSTQNELQEEEEIA